MNHHHCMTCGLLVLFLITIAVHHWVVTLLILAFLFLVWIAV